LITDEEAASQVRSAVRTYALG